MKKWKKELKRIVAIALAILLAGTVVDLSALEVFAAENDTTTCTTHTFAEGVCTVCGITGGECGAVTNENGTTNVQWTFDEATNTLTISGSGAMADYYWDNNRAPWDSNKGSIQTVIIDGEITSIGKWAFDTCENLTSITIPDSVTSIGEGAFYDCHSLTSINIPNSVKSIGESAFGQSGLTSITIPNSVTSIEYETFYNCDALKSVTIPNSVESIGKIAFNDCDALESITILDGVTSTSIGSQAFAGCSALKSVTIPDSVTSIGVGAFTGCNNLTTVNASCKWKTNIDSGNFYGAKQIETVTYTHTLGGGYTVSGNKLYDSCVNGCTLEEPVVATLEVSPDADLSYTGSEVKPAMIMTYPEDWVGEKIQPTAEKCTYSNNTDLGTATCTYTYADGLTLSADFTITKGVPTFDEADMPTISGTYGEALSNMKLSKTSDTSANNITGTWSLTEADADSIYPVVGGDTTYEITFTPDDTTNYETVTKRITANVAAIQDGTESGNGEVAGAEGPDTPTGTGGKNTPKTGDDSSIALWAMLLVAGFGFVVAGQKKSVR